jgi:hypothetical protein
MDLACGFDPLREPQADGRPIIGVQLPVRSVRDTSGAFLWPQVYDGLRYVVDRADRLARAMRRDPPPVVVNLSYGAIAGPHDGSSPLERAIDELIGLRTDRAHAPLQVVLPAGNHHLSRCHARIDVPTEEPAELRWRILPDCRTPSILEIWLPKPRESERREVAVQVVPPTGDASPPLKEGDHYVWDRGGVLCQATYDPQPAGGDRPLIQVVVEATATLDASKAVAPCGLWRVQIEYSGPDAVIDAWIQRNDTPFGWPILGRQSYFDDPNYVRFDANGRERQRDDDTSYVKRAGSLNSIATGERPVVIGGARRSDGTVAIYSGAGPTMGPTSGPDAIAASDQSPARYGVIAAGTRSGAVFRMTGTSVAAPQVTRLIAEELSERRPGDRAAVQKWAGAYTIRKSSSPPPLDPRSGAGLISTPTAPPGAKRE